MAGDWIKMRKDLPMDPAVIGISARLGIEEDSVVGKLHRLWSWADGQTKNGFLPNVDFAWIDRFLRAEKFSETLAQEGWISRKDGGVLISKFKRHNGKSGKERALKNRRQAKYRAKNGASKSGAKSATFASTREEKRREEKNKGVNPLKPPLPEFPENLNTPEFTTAWTAWQAHRKEIDKPLKSQMIAGQLRMLSAKGHGPAIAMIEHTIAMGWQGLRDPDPQEKNGAGKQDSERPRLDPSIFGESQ